MRPGIARCPGHARHTRQPEGSKADRTVAQSAKIENGHVHLPNQADWLDSLLLELLAFPNGRHDDQVDSVSQFLKWVAREMFYEQSLGLGLPVVPSAPVGECY